MCRREYGDESVVGVVVGDVGVGGFFVVGVVGEGVGEVGE